MKICFLGPANSLHIIKWCQFFSSRGYDIDVISFTAGDIENVKVHFIETGVGRYDSDKKKILYLLKVNKIRKLLKEIKPDIVSAHYATSYGMIAALSCNRKYFLSVWGSDIYDFPNHGFLHRKLLEYSLKKAPVLLSTSKAMADEAAKYTDKEFFITPFGVDMELFNPNKRTRTDNDGKFVIGNIKALEDKYGIDYLLKAAAIFKRNNPDVNLEVRIGGKGSKEDEYKGLAKELGIDSIVFWLGFIAQEKVAAEWANMDVAVINSSSSESFGVSAVEAQACGVPVIVSNVPGLMEATSPSVSSMVVPRANEFELEKAISFLYNDINLSRTMGKKGREYVNKAYSLFHCFEYIERIFLGCGYEN